MPDLNHILLYVDNPQRSAAFYARLLGQAPIDVSPTFALFILASGFKLGLWSRHTVAPAATPVGGSELGFTVGSAGEVDHLHAQWVQAGVTVILAPQQMAFGYTFTAIDPDGHRLRVYDLSGV